MLLTSGENHAEAPHMVIAFIVLVAESAPGIVSYKTINSQLLVPRQLAQPPSDTLNYIRKLKLLADRKITNVTGKDGAIEAVRSVGYRFAAGWEVVAVPSVVDSVLQALSGVLTESVVLMRRTPLVEDKTGRRSLLIDSPQSEVVPLLVRLDECAEQVLMQVTNNHQVWIVVGRLLTEMRTYVAFERVGQVDEATWRGLFVSELQMHLNRLGELVHQS